MKIILFLRKISIFINIFYQDGQVDKAIRILEHMKEAGSPINEHIFESLIHGYSLLGEMEKADELIEVMSELNLEPNHLIYTAKMRGMIKYGHGKLLKAISRNFIC